MIDLKVIKSIKDSGQRKWANFLAPYVSELIHQGFGYAYVSDWLAKEHEIQVSEIGLRKIMFRYRKSSPALAAAPEQIPSASAPLPTVEMPTDGKELARQKYLAKFAQNKVAKPEENSELTPAEEAELFAQAFQQARLENERALEQSRFGDADAKAEMRRRKFEAEDAAKRAAQAEAEKK